MFGGLNNSLKRWSPLLKEMIWQHHKPWKFKMIIFSSMTKSACQGSENLKMHSHGNPNI